MRVNDKRPEEVQPEPQVTDNELLQIVLMWVKKLPYEVAVQVLEGAEKSRVELLASRKKSDA